MKHQPGMAIYREVAVPGIILFPRSPSLIIAQIPDTFSQNGINHRLNN